MDFSKEDEIVNKYYKAVADAEAAKNMTGPRTTSIFDDFFNNKSIRSAGMVAIVLGAFSLLLYFYFNWDKVDPLFIMALALLFLGVAIRIWFCKVFG
jgi:hypothetical protein